MRLLSLSLRTLLAGSLLLAASDSMAIGEFVRVTDAANPIVSTPGPDGYTGASWVDYDGDGDQDLFVNNNRLFRNDGGGNFVSVATSLGAGQPTYAGGNGNSWADFDNDGDLDCYIASTLSRLYRNDGDGVFVAITAGVIGQSTSNRGWACAWADYDNNGWVDLLVTHPATFVPGTPTTNHLFSNVDGMLTRDIDSDVTTGLAPYTVGTWADYDDDGDQDLVIGSGPADGSQAPDYLYRNQLVETGTATLTRLDQAPLSTVLFDGQVWNWIDIDNDLDLDAYVTNWGGTLGGLPNVMFRNDDGSLVQLTQGFIVTEPLISLANVWADFDNDGDLDCYVANDGGQRDRIYTNEGNGVFSRDPVGPVMSLETRRGATAADYDDDGHVDLFVVGPGSATALYRNVGTSGNWISITCQGTLSNRAAIGAKVKLQAMIDGQLVWQRRDVSAQNSFNGQSSLRAHFGLGDATQVKQILVEWPSGNQSQLFDIATNQFLTIVEESSVPTLVSNFESALFDEGVDVRWELVGDSFQSTRLLRAIDDSPAEEIATFGLDERHGHFVDTALSVRDGALLTYRLQVLDASGASLVLPAETTTLLRRAVPTRSRLLPNVPNPFNPATDVRFELARGGHVHVAIYDPRGRWVDTLLDEELGPGQHRLRWNGRNASGAPQASGTYYCRVEGAGFLDTCRLVLLK